MQYDSAPLPVIMICLSVITMSHRVKIQKENKVSFSERRGTGQSDTPRVSNEKMTASVPRALCAVFLQSLMSDVSVFRLLQA